MGDDGMVRALGVGVRGPEAADDDRGRAPVILLHAFPLDSRMWMPLVGELVQRGVVPYAFDAPGFGATAAWPDVEPSIEAVADAAVAASDDLGVASAHWIGCSMGGYVALAIAERHPRVVAGLGLVDTRSGADDQEKRQARLEKAEETERLERLIDPKSWAEPLIGTEGQERADLVDFVADMVASAPPAAVSWGLRAMASRPDRTEVLGGFDRPAVIVWGERDTVSGLDEAERMAKALGVQVARVPGVGHLSPLEAPSAVADALANLYLG